MSYILSLRDINYSYIDGGFERKILNELSFDFERGKFYTILGPSGSGKSTLLAIMAGLDYPGMGSITFEDKSIDSTNVEKYRRNDISIVFQQYNLITYLTAAENVMMAMSETDNETPKDKKAIAYNLLEKFGIAKTKAGRIVAKLSGGEQQRVAIARAIASNVDLIFADEPTGNLDSDTEREIIAIFKELAHEYGKTIVVVTHSETVAEYSDQKLLLKYGKLYSLDER